MSDEARQGRKISLGEARQMALQVAAETEKNLHEERIAEARFIEAITGFYGELLSKQERLGEEFERVLHDNLDDLIVRT